MADDGADASDGFGVAIAIADGQATTISDSINEGHLLKVDDDLKEVFGCHVFKDIVGAEALAIGQGATQAPYAHLSLKTAMAGPDMTYECGDNFFKHNLMYSARAKIPVIQSRIDDLMDTEFKTPCRYPSTLVISMPDKDFDPYTQLGSWYSISPEEYRRAYLGAIARDIRAQVDVETLNLWRAYVLSTSMKFVVHTTEMDRYYAATNIKERLADQYEYTRTSTYQRIEEICLYKSKLEIDTCNKVSHDKLQSMYNKNVRLAKKAEPINKSWVDMAIKIHDAAFSLPAVREVVESMEMYGSQTPFNYITVLHGFVSKARTPSNITWVFTALFDLVRSKEFCLSDISVRFLVGDTTSGQRGFIDLLILQKEFKEYLQGPALMELGMKPEISQRIACVLQSHGSYRARLTGFGDLPASIKPSTTWMSGWQTPVLDFIAFVEDPYN